MLLLTQSCPLILLVPRVRAGIRRGGAAVTSREAWAHGCSAGSDGGAEPDQGNQSREPFRRNRPEWQCVLEVRDLRALKRGRRSCWTLEGGARVVRLIPHPRISMLILHPTSKGNACTVAIIRRRHNIRKADIVVFIDGKESLNFSLRSLENWLAVSIHLRFISQHLLSVYKASPTSYSSSRVTERIELPLPLLWSSIFRWWITNQQENNSNTKDATQNFRNLPTLAPSKIFVRHKVVLYFTLSTIQQELFHLFPSSISRKSHS